MNSEQCAINIMKIKLLFLIMVFVANVSGATNDSLFARIKGEWADAGWVKVIKEKHSPRTAAAKTRAYVTQAIITDKDSLYELSLILNNGHEGTGPMPFREIVKVSSNRYQLRFNKSEESEETGYNNTTATGDILLVGKDSMIILSGALYSGLHSDTLVRLGTSISSFVNKNTVSGNYYNDKGENFIFQENGTVIWNKKHFKYDVQIDYVLIGDDCIIVKPNSNYKEDKWYGFKVEGKTLLLYP